MKKYVTVLTAMLCLMFAFGLNTKAISLEDFGDYNYVVKNGTVELTAYYGSSSRPIIPTYLDGKKVTKIGDQCFCFNKNIKVIIIPNTVTTIGELAFFGCSNISNVYFSDSVKNIGEGAFDSCSSLKVVYLPKGLKTIPESCFGGCSSLHAVSIPSSVTTIAKSAFIECKNLPFVTIPNGVKKIDSYAFASCYKLKTIVIPKSVKYIGPTAFWNWPGLTVKGYDGTAAEQFATANYIPFATLTKRVKSVKISGSTHWVWPGKTIQLKATVSPSNAENKKVTWSSSNTRVATVDQNGLVKIKLRSAGKSVTIKATAKDRSKKSASWTITSKNPAKVGSIQTVGKNRYVVTSKSTVRYKVPVSKKITSVRIPKSVKIYGKKYKVTAIAKKAFFNCKDLEKVTIKSSIKKIGKYAFYKCKKLKAIKIYSTNLTENSVLTGAFKGISKKATFYVPKGKKAAYKKIFLKRGAKETMMFKTN